VIKFENIIKFLTIFLSGDLKLEHQSPDYILEKFEKFFGKDIKIKESKCVTSLSEKHNQIWKHDDYRINSIFNFFYGVHTWVKYNDIKIDWGCKMPYKAVVFHSNFNSGINNILCEPETIVELFKENIGDFSDIHNEEIGGALHPILVRDMYNVYFYSTEEDNENYFLKLERKEKLKKILKND